MSETYDNGADVYGGTISGVNSDGSGNQTVEICIDPDITDNDIDEMLGVENTDHDGIGVSMIADEESGDSGNLNGVDAGDGTRDIGDSKRKGRRRRARRQISEGAYEDELSDSSTKEGVDIEDPESAGDLRNNEQLESTGDSVKAEGPKIDENPGDSGDSDQTRKHGSGEGIAGESGLNPCHHDNSGDGGNRGLVRLPRNEEIIDSREGQKLPERNESFDLVNDDTDESGGEFDEAGLEEQRDKQRYEQREELSAGLREDQGEEQSEEQDDEQKKYGIKGTAGWERFIVPATEMGYGAMRYAAEANRPEGTAQEGLREAMVSAPVQVMRILTQAGGSSVYAMIENDDRVMSLLGELCESLFAQGQMIVEDLRRDRRDLRIILDTIGDENKAVKAGGDTRSGMTEARGKAFRTGGEGGSGFTNTRAEVGSKTVKNENEIGIGLTNVWSEGTVGGCRLSMADKLGILKNRERLAEKFEARSLLIDAMRRRPEIFSEKELEIISSGDFFRSGNVKESADLYQKVLRERGATFSKPLQTMSSKELGRLIKMDGLGISSDQKGRVLNKKGRSAEGRGSADKKIPDKNVILLKDLKRRAEKREAARKRHMGWAGARRVTGVVNRVGFTLVVRGISADENYAKSIQGIRNAIIMSGVGIKAVQVSGKVVGKVTGLSYVSGKARSYVSGGIRRTIRNVSAPIRTFAAQREEKKLWTKAEKRMKRAESGFHAGKSESSFRLEKAGGRHSNSGKYGSGRKNGSRRSKNGRGRNRTGIIRRIVKPVIATGRAVEVIRSLFVNSGRYLGLALVVFVGIYTFITLVGEMTRSLDAVLEGWGESGSELVEHFKDGYESVIEYSHYKDMQDDINMLLEEDEKTYEKAKALGEGHPVNDEVLEGHHIDRYGCPDKEKGYTIHYLDPYGNEISSRASNVKDVEALCVAMVANEIGDYKNYKKDLARFDELLLDMYEEMLYHDPDTGLPFRYEESDIYTCLNGCDEYEYCCNDAGAYSTYEKYKSDGCGTYGGLEPFSGEGCEVMASVGEDGDGDGGNGDTDESGSGDEERKTAGGSGGEDGSSQNVNGGSHGYCPGHSVPICYGHKDVDIYITLYDVVYAFSENIYPENRGMRRYRQMVREFMRNGQGRSKWYAKIARNYVDGDWYELYGVLVEGAEFHVGDELSDEDIDEIRKIIEENGGDISKAREALIAFGLKYVGKISYKYGAKAGSSTPGELDCSGFVQWVFREALGKSVPCSTGGYAGYKTKKYEDLKPGDLGFIFVGGSNASTGTYNHVGIYCGKNGAGQDMWLHCSSGGGGVVLNSTGMFKVFVDPFGE